MNSPYREPPALPPAKTIPFPKRPPSRLEQLLGFEEDVRRQKTGLALSLFVVNEAARVLSYGQAFHFRAGGKGRMRLVMASSLADVPAEADFGLSLAKSLTAKPPGTVAIEVTGYPLRHGSWHHLKDGKGRVFGGLLFANGSPWAEADRVVAARITETTAHAFTALTPPSLLRAFTMPRWLWLGVPLIAAALAFIPVPMTTLAPFEVIADQPAVVAAPLDGVIERIDAEPNSAVAQGAALFAFETIELRARADIAQKREWVAEAKLATARQASFADPKAKRDVAVAEREHELAKSERAFAEAELARAEVAAPRAGLLIYSAKSDWIGRPVSAGERIMEIADESMTIYSIELAAKDAIALAAGAKVRIFLDSDPLTVRGARIREAAFHAAETPGGGFAFRILAESDGEFASPRIGLRGTAQILGEETTLGFYLFRRPLSAARQWLGL